MKILAVFLTLSIAVFGTAYGQEPSAIKPEMPIDSVKALNGGNTLYFRTIDYSSMICDSPRVAADASLITHGISLYGDATADAQWIQKHKDNRSCHEQAPDKKFEVSPAVPVYINSALVIWVVGVIVPGTDKSLGFIPVDSIQIIGIPTL